MFDTQAHLEHELKVAMARFLRTQRQQRRLAMHGLSDIVRLNTNAPSQTVASSNVDDDFADIAALVKLLRSPFAVMNNERSRIADYLVAAYGITE